MKSYTFGFACIAGLAIVLFTGACATQKSRYDQSRLSKIYHDVTAKYNGYFNANELLQASITELSAQHLDNYNQLLELYPYRAAPNPKAVAADLDEAIKKVSVVVTLHENSHWADDCYLLIGKAFYLKQDFESAQNALEFFMDEFNPDGTRTAKKPRRTNPNISRDRARAQAQRASERERAARAKAAEKARKQYNKQLRKNQKRSARKGGSSRAPAPTRRTAREMPPPPTQPEKETLQKEASKSSENPGGLRHQPAHQEASLWLARTYVERENYPGVERILNALKSNPNLQDDVRRELPVVWAYYSIKRKNYSGAIPHLEQGIEMARKRDEKSRMAFVLGQIAERDGQYDVAYRNYARVVDFRPDYTLDFNARLSMARTALFSGNQSYQDVASMLDRMLRDSKNEEFKDQIYFTLAQIALKQNDIALAVVHLESAVQHSHGNAAQLTESNYLLGKLQFERGDYVAAKNAYDATLRTMLQTDTRYKPVERLSRNLTEIAKHLTDIAHQDSLLRISRMSEEEQRLLAQTLHAQKGSGSPASLPGGLPAAGIRGVGGKAGDDGLVAVGAAPVGLPGGQQSAQNAADVSNFFAYHRVELRRGQREFRQSWGNRALSDNWRVSSIAGGHDMFDPIAGVENIYQTPQVSDADIAEILKDVPDTEEKIHIAEEIIQNAMLQLGSLYRDRLEEYRLSIETLEGLLTRYPDTKYTLDAFYQLYVSYVALGDHVKAEYYKNRIINEYPTSKFALVLSDPEYLSRLLTEEQRLDRTYHEIYNLVHEGNFEEAQEKITQSKATFGTNHKFYPRLTILEAMCTGHLVGRDAYVDALRHVIASYPNSPEETKARDMLLLLGEYQGSRLNLSRGAAAADFRVQHDALHFILISVRDQKDSDAQDVKVSVANFNRKYHNLDKLKISSLRFDAQGDEVLILVRSFKNGEEAMHYYKGTKQNASEFAPPGTRYEVFPVTQHNYREIVKQKSVEDYRPFFTTNYR